MFSFFKFFIRNSFRTLPDGQRVFVNPGFFKSTYFLLPDTNLETILKNKVFWANIVSAALATVVIVGLFIAASYLKITLTILLYSFLFLLRISNLYVRQAVVRKDILKLQKIETPDETFYFYDSFTNKTEAGKNNIPLNYKIAKYLDIPQNDDKILLLVYERLLPIVVRCALGGWVIWQSEINLKTPVNIDWFNNRILISGDSNLSFFLDANTGVINEEN